MAAPVARTVSCQSCISVVDVTSYLQHKRLQGSIRNSIKTRTGSRLLVLCSQLGRHRAYLDSPPAPGGASAAVRGSGARGHENVSAQLKYFQKGMHGLRAPGEGYRIFRARRAELVRRRQRQGLHYTGKGASYLARNSSPRSPGLVQ